MARVELIMPKMGESIMEATILKWLKKPGDKIEQDESVLEVATDKVDTEVPSTHAGVLTEILAKEGEVVKVGAPIAILTSEIGESVPTAAPAKIKITAKPQQAAAAVIPVTSGSNGSVDYKSSGRFYSPLVRNIAKAESIAVAELETIAGSGQAGRVTKKDILNYVQQRIQGGNATRPSLTSSTPMVPASINAGDEIIQMDRMRKMIADHMVMSKQTSPHVTSFVEVDMTNAVLWRDRVKDEFQKKYNQKITFTPIFIEAVCKAIRDFPMINVSVSGTQIIRKLDINIGMATALPSGNLIVPVIKGADRLNLAGLSYAVNDLAARARDNKLKPEEIQDGTFTLTNVGSFGNVMGTPIINQPQVAILATGTIKKKPAVIETEAGDLIGIRHMMFLSLSYDHRVVDGSLGGRFIRKVADYLEQFDLHQSV